MSAPPRYSQSEPTASASSSVAVPLEGTQIIINPTPDTLNFQKGYLGVEGETAALEGEIEIKSAAGQDWDAVTITLQSVESVAGQTIDLVSRAMTLYSKADAPPNSSFPTSLPFSVPLTSDTPQCIHSNLANITHRLTVALHPSASTSQPLQKSVIVHTRRYSSRFSPLPISPESLSISDPVKVDVQLARRTFYAGELIPVYIVVPPLDGSILRKKELILRNVMAEMHRSVNITITGHNLDGAEPDVDDDMLSITDTHGARQTDASSSQQSMTGSGSRRLAESSTRQNVVSRTGASCRFHDTKPLKLRLLLRTPPAEPERSTSPASSATEVQGDNDCSFITQATLLHSVTFTLVVMVNFINSTRPNERTVSLSIPITILPPQAGATEIDSSIDEAYHKKHDRPPIKTTRHPQADEWTTRDDLSAGPSGAPPPFDTAYHDGPPPFFASEAESSATSLHPPTFVESQADLADLPSVGDAARPAPNVPLSNNTAPDGEGVLFGFRSSDEFDGMGSQRNDVSIPATESSGTEADAGIEDGSRATMNGDIPPPPPALDDPLDPPPTIDGEYLAALGTADAMQGQPPPPHSDEDPHPIQTISSNPPPSRTNEMQHLPPPYATPAHAPEVPESTTGPPPYIESHRSPSP